MTDTIDTGEIARPVSPATLGRVYRPDPPTEILFTGPPADETARIELGHTPGYALVVDLRPPNPDTHGPSPQYRPVSLADTVISLDPRDYPPMPAPTPTPTKWNAPAAEHSVVPGPRYWRGRHRKGWTWQGVAAISVGSTLLAEIAAVGVSVLAGVQW